MSKNNNLSGPILIALKDALTHIYWTKADLRLFVQQSISNKTFVVTINWDDYKRNIASEIVDRMSNRLDIFGDDLELLIRAILNINDFSHFDKWDDSDVKKNNAKKAIEILKKHFNGNREKKLENDKTITRKKNSEIIQKNVDFQHKLDDLKNQFTEMGSMDNHQQRGFLFETFLYDLFRLSDIDIKKSYKTSGEQIDGAFTCNNQDYLLEAKWVDKQIPKSTLYEFQGKVSNKLENTLGIFISVNGFSEECKSISKSNIILFDYCDILLVLDNRISLRDLIYRKKQHASRTGEILFHPLS